MELAADAATLDEIVAFLGEYDASELVDLPLTDVVDTNEGATSSSSSSGDGGEPIKPKRSVQKTLNSNRARERKKRELLQLQKEAEVLDRQLVTLLQAKATRTSGAAQENAYHSLAVHRERMRAWKDMALRVYRRRRMAEAENIRLKELVVEQREVLRGLQRVLQRQLTHSKVQSSDMIPQSMPPMEGLEDPRAMMQMLAELLSGLKIAYNTTDSWLTTTCSMRAAGLQNDAKFVALSSTQFVIEVVDVRFFPFDLHRVAEAYWAMGVNYHCREFDIFREDTEVEGRETIFREQVIQDDEAGGRVRLRKHASVQRFIEKNRVVILNASRYRSVQVLQEELSGITCSEYHWNVFQAPDADTQDASLWTSTVRVTLDIHHGHTLPTEEILILNDYFSAKLKRDCDAVVTLMEDYLLQSPHSRKRGHEGPAEDSAIFVSIG
ncbi:hypothetical protein Poli38472_007565 [Pythium oligandrum]|uniref:BZIP domain-containing protein n=1 Tax=Pythium oligandrum TaxID=41045 RepID=A0A8K1CS02_PYTOL|nr:hypothetical protein Poli38472_007565 [Pythium oligandrum]|eukprot:TMW67893.1 hypothetical protein Poli38472_007565 [Pythium oligandrum]